MAEFFGHAFLVPKLQATVSIEGVQKLVVIRNYVAIWGPPRPSRKKWSQRGSTQVQKLKILDKQWLIKLAKKSG